MGKDLSGKSLPRLIKGLERQGAGIKVVKSGWRILFPDGSTAVVHTSVSDRRGLLNLQASIKRAGLDWPL